jgi:hypothetical protein
MDLKIDTYSTLYNLIEMDSEYNPIKEIGRLFLCAMNDWPTQNEIIEAFTKELKEYFGNPITVKNIHSKKLIIGNHNSWKHESGSSISELIKLSEIELNETNFEKILNIILNKYELQYREVDFIAELDYLETKNGGRKTEANSGYRPQMKFNFSENTSSGSQTFIDKEYVNPGEKVIAKIKVFSPSFFEKQLYEGIEFKFVEGNQVMGNGKIIKIINNNLGKTNH